MARNTSAVLGEHFDQIIEVQISQGQKEIAVNLDD